MEDKCTKFILRSTYFQFQELDEDLYEEEIEGWEIEGVHQRVETIRRRRKMKRRGAVAHPRGARCGIKVRLYCWDVSQLIKDWLSTDSITMGINE